MIIQSPENACNEQNQDKTFGFLPQKLKQNTSNSFAKESLNNCDLIQSILFGKQSLWLFASFVLFDYS